MLNNQYLIPRAPSLCRILALISLLAGAFPVLINMVRLFFSLDRIDLGTYHVCLVGRVEPRLMFWICRRVFGVRFDLDALDSADFLNWCISTSSGGHG